jgi:glycosyltransferase involved in cell wall biosynthesis
MERLASISIVIPAYNEERRLPATLRSILEYLRTRDWAPWEIVVVNDGSKDGTAAVAARFAAEHAGVRVLENPGNRGKGYSVRHGMLEAQGDWALFTDADLSAPIEELDKMIAAARASGASVAIGSRAVDRRLIAVRQSLFRETAGRIFNLLMRAVTGLPFADTQCGFKLFERNAVQQVFRRQRIERWGFDAEVLFIAQKFGYKIVEVPVRWSHSEGTKVSMFGDSVNMFLDLLRIRRNHVRGLYR